MAPRRLAIIIGAMKSGTTSLFHHLARHPQIAPCSDKEPDFFSVPENWAKGLDHYLDLWPDWKPEKGQVALEASTSYTKQPRRPDVPERMAQAAEALGLDLRFIYVMRDPLDRITSHLTHAIAGGRPDQHHLEGIRFGSIEGHTLEVTMYATQLDAYMERFDRSRFHLVRFEDLLADPQAAGEAICRFLDLDTALPDRAPERRNPSIGKYDKGPVWRWLEATDLIRVTELVPEPIKASLRDAMGQEIEERWEPTELQERFLLRALARDLERLQEVHGVDTSAWPTMEKLAALEQDS